MADLSTVNYGWVKPTVGSDADSWGGVLNADLDGIDGVVGNIASIIEVAGTELINISTSASSLSSSLTGVGASLGGVSTSLGDVSSSLGGVSASTSGIGASLGTVSSSLGAVSSSLGAVSTSLANVSASTVYGTTAGTVAEGNDSRFGGMPVNNQPNSYTLASSDAGALLLNLTYDGGPIWTIPSNSSVAFPVGTVIHGVIGSQCATTLEIAGGDNLFWSDGDKTGTRTLGAGAGGGPGQASCMFTLIKYATHDWLITATGSIS